MVISIILLSESEEVTIMMAHKNTATIADISETQVEIMQELKLPLRLLTKETILGNPVKRSTPMKYDLSAFSRRKPINWACYRVPIEVDIALIIILSKFFHQPCLPNLTRTTHDERFVIYVGFSFQQIRNSISLHSDHLQIIMLSQILLRFF